MEKKREEKLERVIIFDTTLRDGEQSPGASMNVKEKLEVARQLARLGVDVIEAGFPSSSRGDFEAVNLIAQEIKGPSICGLARAMEADIERCAAAVKPAKKTRIHTFIATSPLHMKMKLKMTPRQVVERAVTAVKLAKSFVNDVEFSCEDAGRSDWQFLVEILTEVIKAGATTVNIPDTVGYTMPWEFGECIRYLKAHVPNINQAIISVHCHNDLGLAVANSLSAVQNGARQVECTINGIGERAGNASLEEIVMAIRVRQDLYKCYTNINTREIYPSSRLVSQITGIRVQPNKAIVGANAFAHEAGIHQDGVLKERTTYEIMLPEDVGWIGESMVMGKHSGRHAFRKKLEALGFRLKQEELEHAFQRFKELCDKKIDVYDEDLYAIVGEELSGAKKTYELIYLHTTSGTGLVPTATVKVKKGDEIILNSANGDGPIDAAYRAIDGITQMPARLEEFNIEAVTGGKEAVGQVTVKVSSGKRIARGRGSDTDVVVASAKAYLNAINSLLIQEEGAAEKRGM